jgi:hypothetical protein
MLTQSLSSTKKGTFHWNYFWSIQNLPSKCMRFSLSGHVPLRVLIFVAIIICRHYVHKQDVFGLRLQACDAHFESGKHSPFFQIFSFYFYWYFYSNFNPFKLYLPHFVIIISVPMEANLSQSGFVSNVTCILPTFWSLLPFKFNWLKDTESNEFLLISLASWMSIRLAFSDVFTGGGFRNVEELSKPFNLDVVVFGVLVLLCWFVNETGIDLESAGGCTKDELFDELSPFGKKINFNFSIKHNSVQPCEPKILS